MSCTSLAPPGYRSASERGRAPSSSPVRSRCARGASVCCSSGRLQERVFPRQGRGEPFLGDHERRAIDAALADAGEAPLGLRPHEDPLDAERYQLYAAVSRPTELLVLSWHRADEDGEPAVRSPFVDDVLDVLAPAPEPRDRRLGSVGWDERDDASPRQRELAAALRSGREPACARPRGEPPRAG